MFLFRLCIKMFQIRLNLSRKVKNIAYFFFVVRCSLNIVNEEGHGKKSNVMERVIMAIRIEIQS